MGPQHNKTMAAAALAEWNPKARRVIRRILLFNPPPGHWTTLNGSRPGCRHDAYAWYEPA